MSNLRKTHNFNVQLAITLGIEEAILLQNIEFWLEKNKANNKNIRDGYVWTYNSTKAFEEMFPYMKAPTINRKLNNLEKDGYIKSTSDYNKMKIDRTKWYTIEDKYFQILGEKNPFKIDNSISQNDYWNNQNDKSNNQNEEAIPDILTNIETDRESPSNFLGNSFAHNQHPISGKRPTKKERESLGENNRDLLLKIARELYIYETNVLGKQTSAYTVIANWIEAFELHNEYLDKIVDAYKSYANLESIKLADEHKAPYLVGLSKFLREGYYISIIELKKQKPTPTLQTKPQPTLGRDDREVAMITMKEIQDAIQDGTATEKDLKELEYLKNKYQLINN